MHKVYKGRREITITMNTKQTTKDITKLSIWGLKAIEIVQKHFGLFKNAYIKATPKKVFLVWEN